MSDQKYKVGAVSMPKQDVPAKHSTANPDPLPAMRVSVVPSGSGAAVTVVAAAIPIAEAIARNSCFLLICIASMN
jgi:hypothetical protein